MSDFVLLALCAVIGCGIILFVIALNIFVCIKDCNKKETDLVPLNGIYIHPI